MGEGYRGDDPKGGPRIERSGSQGSTDDLDRDAIHALLDHERRRTIVDVVDDADVLSTRELATEIAARESETSREDVDEERRRSVEIALYHVHLPKLVEAGVIAAEDGTARLRAGPNADQVLGVLRAIDGNASSVDLSQ